MMKPAKLILLLALVATALAGLTLSAGGERDDFILENADGSRTVGLSSSPTLSGLIGAVLTRFTLEFADGSRTAPLDTPPAGLAALVNALAPRVMMEFADGSATRPLSYPRDLVGDTTAPIISNAAVAPGGAGLTFTWDTDEPALGRLLYGAQPGQLNQTASETLYAGRHSLTIPAAAEQGIYYRIVSIDRGGNMAQTAEQSVEAATTAILYLPSVLGQ